VISLAVSSLLLSILSPVSIPQATAAPALVTCVNLQTGTERISHTGKCRITQEAQANWQKNPSDSPIASGPTAKVINICSNKESSPVSYQVIRKKCARHQVTTVFSRSGSLPAKPVIAEAVSFGYDSASLKLATDPATNADAPVAYYTITSTTVDTRTPVIVQSQKVYYWKDLSVAINTLQASTRYTFTISATTADGTSPVSIASVPVTTQAYVAPASSSSGSPTVAVPAFTLSSIAETKTVNNAISGYTITSTGGTIASYAISPSAPAGTTFNSSTGLLTGTPTSSQGATAYTITATNAGGSATRTFTLTVEALTAPVFSLSSTSETRVATTALAGYTISSTGGAIASYALTGTLPAGLAFSTSTGLITGTPTETKTATTYTITATNAAGSTSATYRLRVTGDIGDVGPGGGIIYYYQAAGFNCGPTRASTCKFLEAAPSGWNTGADPAISWATNINDNQTTAVPAGGAALNGIGNGYKNSEEIVAQTGNVAASSAAVAARAYRGNDLTDWYLPTSDEVQELYNQRTTVGGLGTDFYWSSRQTGTNLASAKRFSDGAGGSGNKSSAFLVRPIRAF
jgi:hypothetical protein